MEQNQILFYVMAIGCTLCIMFGIYKNPVYLAVLAVRGLFCSILIYGIHVICLKQAGGFSCPPVVQTVSDKEKV